MNETNFKLPSPLEKLASSFLEEYKLNLYVKRDDLIHAAVSGNKWRKLKFNLQEALNREEVTVLTFGGAFSNHIVATAVAAKSMGLKSIGVIRGNEFEYLNPSLQEAEAAGMKLHFVSRQEYKQKENESFTSALKDNFGPFYLIPEGGANQLGVKGCAELVEEINLKPDYYALSAGTGTTAAGILSATESKVMVFPALKGGEGLKQGILEFQLETEKEAQLIMQTNYHFGGYARISEELVEFVNQFYATYNIPLDLVYTGKMMYGLFQLIKQQYFEPNQTVVAVHTGGLQGNRGMEKRYQIQLDYG